MSFQLKDSKVVIFDLDGTIYNGDVLIKDADKLVSFFRKNDVKVFFGTNNSSKSRSFIAKKINNMGISCSFKEVVTSSYLTACFLKEKNINDVYVIGAPQLKKEIKNRRINIVTENHAKNLVIGFSKNLTYSDFSSAFRVALHAKNIIACNKDRSYPDSENKLWPGCGYVSSIVEWCANRKDVLTIGKPNDYLIKHIKNITKVDFAKILCIGDTYETDYIAAKKCHAQCILVGHDNSQYHDVYSVNTLSDVITMLNN